MKPYYPDAIDPHRPWIKDARDNPHEMNWGQTLFNPLGSSPKLHFSRAWTFMFMGRVLLFIVPVFAVFVASLSGADLSETCRVGRNERRAGRRGGCRTRGAG